MGRETETRAQGPHPLSGGGGAEHDGSHQPQRAVSPSPGAASDGGAARAPVLCARGLDKLGGSVYATPIPVCPQARPPQHARTLSRAPWTPTLRAMEPRPGWALQRGRHVGLAGKRPTRLLPTLQDPRRLHGEHTGQGESRHLETGTQGVPSRPQLPEALLWTRAAARAWGQPGRTGSESPTPPGPRRYAGPPGAGAGTGKQTRLCGQATLSTGHQDSEDTQA